MTVSYRVHLLRLIYVHGAGKYPAGWIEMRQAASIQGDLGRSPASACRPRPWWTCSHGEVIHDVTAVSCRWRADRGPKRAWLSFPVFFFFFSCMCLLSHRSALAHGRKRNYFYCCQVCCMTECLHGCWASFFFPGWTSPNVSLPANMWCFVFPWDF